MRAVEFTSAKRKPRVVTRRAAQKSNGHFFLSDFGFFFSFFWELLPLAMVASVGSRVKSENVRTFDKPAGAVSTTTPPRGRVNRMIQRCGVVG
jgi:hypothetical protein